MSKKMARYKITAFGKLLIFAGVSTCIVMGANYFTQKLDFVSKDQAISLHEIKNTLKETFKEKIEEVKDKSGASPVSNTATEERLEVRLMELIEENERLAEELKECRNTRTEVVNLK